jgi:alkylation response protein AidB-like acyl-CoA dehydrogenase
VYYNVNGEQSGGAQVLLIHAAALALVVAKWTTLARRGRPSSKHGAHTIVAVELPHPSVKMVRPLTHFGYDDVPHGHAEVMLENVELGEEDLILLKRISSFTKQCRMDESITV